MSARAAVATIVFTVFTATLSSLAAPTAALAQGEEGGGELFGSKPQLAVTFKPRAGKDPAESAVAGEFVCEGECPFPDETLLNVGLRRKGQDKYIGDAWARTVVSGGKFKVSLGPWGERRIIRGDYEIDAWMEMARQPNHVYTELRQKYRFNKDHRELLSSAKLTVGPDAGAESDTREVNDQLRAMFATLKQLSEEISLMIAKKPAPAPEERKKWRAERMVPLTKVSDDLKQWYSERIGILGEEHVGFIELLIAAVNQQMRYWERSPQSPRVGSYGDQAAKLIADFESIPLPGEKLKPLPGGADEDSGEGEGG